ncbi:MAG: 50S ribosomal protein L25 [Flavobacteriales bacterium]|nr:50S ribosomal protein L25 [Flavobacteriales bacterium]
MKKAQLSGSLRANVGKKDAKAVRNAGNVPCVLYGGGEQVHFSVRSVDLEKVIFSPDVYQIEIDIDGNKKMAIIQEKQMHPVTDKPRHVDFLELADDRPVKVKLPVRTTGASIGVMNGGKLRIPNRMLRVLGLPADLPESITVDISKLRIGQSVRIKGLEVPNVTFMEPADAVVVGVKMARGAANVDDSEEEEGAEGEGEAASSEE